MISAYKQTSVNTKESLSKNVFNSIRMYLEDYRDTSKSEVDRIDAISKAIIILEWVLVVVSVENHEQQLIYSSLTNIYTKSKLAKDIPNTLQDFNDEIGFLKIIGAK